MSMKSYLSFFRNSQFQSVLAGALLAGLFTAASVYGATTISTNISTGGTLSATGASTLTGAVTTAGAVTLGDAAGDAIIITGNASTSNSFEVNNDLYVNGYATTTGASGNFATAGTLTAIGQTTLVNASTTRLSIFSNLLIGGTSTTTIVGGSAPSTIPYASTTALDVVSQLGVFGTASFGGTATTTVNSAGVIATQTKAANTITFASTTGIDISGYASSTRISCLNNCAFGSTATTTIDSTGVISTQTTLANTITYASTTAVTATTASTTNLIVGGDSANGTLAGIIFGTCNLTLVQMSATSSIGIPCTSATGVTSSYKVFVSATSTLATSTLLTGNTGGFVVSGASSTAANVIGVQITNFTGAINTPSGTLNFWAVR